MTALVIADPNAETLPPEADFVELEELEEIGPADVVVIECQFCNGDDTSDETIDELMTRIGVDADKATGAYNRYVILSVKTDCESCHSRYQNTAMAFDFHRQLLTLRGSNSLSEMKRCAEQRWVHFARMGYKPASSR